MKRFQLLIKQLFPYLIGFAVIFAVMFFGSRQSDEAVKTPIMAAFEDANFTVTADQISEAYTLANIADSVSLPSGAAITNNYIDARLVYEATGFAKDATSTIVEKPTIIDTSSLSTGIISYVVQQGDTVASLAAKYGITKDQLRWSNGFKNESAMKVGATIYIPSVPGIVYKVKSGDSVSNIATKYKSNSEEIIAHNNLENSDIAVNQLILLPNGVLPEKERPEYVAPTPPRTNYNYGSTFVRDSADRHNMIVISNYFYTNSPGNKNYPGQCTWYAWWWRQANGMPLPSVSLGNARSWNVSLAKYGYRVDHTPSYGAVMQATRNRSGYGHVAIVVGVVDGQYITIREMNWGVKYRVTQATIYWQDAIKYNFIH